MQQTLIVDKVGKGGKNYRPWATTILTSTSPHDRKVPIKLRSRSELSDVFEERSNLTEKRRVRYVERAKIFEKKTRIQRYSGRNGCQHAGNWRKIERNNRTSIDDYDKGFVTHVSARSI